MVITRTAYFFWCKSSRTASAFAAEVVIVFETQRNGQKKSAQPDTLPSFLEAWSNLLIALHSWLASKPFTHRGIHRIDQAGSKQLRDHINIAGWENPHDFFIVTLPGKMEAYFLWFVSCITGSFHLTFTHYQISITSFFPGFSRFFYTLPETNIAHENPLVSL